MRAPLRGARSVRLKQGHSGKRRHPLCTSSRASPAPPPQFCHQVRGQGPKKSRRSPIFWPNLGRNGGFLPIQMTHFFGQIFFFAVPTQKWAIRSGCTPQEKKYFFEKKLSSRCDAHSFDKIIFPQKKFFFLQKPFLGHFPLLLQTSGAVIDPQCRADGPKKITFFRKKIEFSATPKELGNFTHEAKTHFFAFLQGPDTEIL